jgi:hypothetical protein
LLLCAIDHRDFASFNRGSVAFNDTGQYYCIDGFGAGKFVDRVTDVSRGGRQMTCKAARYSRATAPTSDVMVGDMVDHREPKSGC